MMKPDVICVWPKDFNYPAYVKRINKDRNLFGRVITVLHDGSPRHDYTQEITSGIKDSIVIDAPNNLTAGGKDWRNVFTNIGLEKVTSDYILFLEQDFFVGDGFFEKLFTLSEGLNAVGFIDHNRLHPACLLVKREMLDKTTKDFGAYPPEDDHFARVTKELMAMGNWKTLQDLGLTEWYHLASLTFSMGLEEEGKPVTYYPNEYKIYKLLSQLI